MTAFEWDAAKNAASIAKHGIDFEDAILIFEGPVLERRDDRREYGEVRVIALGTVDDRELAVVYTMHGEDRRIISARRAHSRERKAYREAYPRQPAAR
ncbi:MAG: BrnT family toxin [Candidatus Binataceae bacterium]